jgi:hypothetical protein
VWAADEVDPHGPRRRGWAQAYSVPVPAHALAALRWLAEAGGLLPGGLDEDRWQQVLVWWEELAGVVGEQGEAVLCRDQLANRRRNRPLCGRAS